MNKLLLTLCAGVIVLKVHASSTEPVVTTLLVKPQRVELIDPDTKTRHFRTRFVAVNERLEPAIRLEHATHNSLGYTLQGNIASGGLSINRLQRIRTEQEIQGTQLTVKHWVQVRRIPGKEAALIRGYNYQQSHTLSLPKHVQGIRIEALEIRTPDASNAKPRMLAEIHLDWPLKRPLSAPSEAPESP